MTRFRHPHLTRGIVHTALGAFRVNRGIMELPDDLGSALGWRPVDPDDEGIDERRDRRATLVRVPARREQR